MNEKIEQRLETEATSDSKGFVSDYRPDGVVSVLLANGCAFPRGACPAGANGPAAWTPPADGVDVPPLVSVAELLRIVKPRGR